MLRRSRHVGHADCFRVGGLLTCVALFCATSACRRDEQRATSADSIVRTESKDGERGRGDLELRETARTILVTNCGQCHDPGSGRALAGALRVFDLGEADWSRRMTSAQLREAQRRLGEPVAPSLSPGEAPELHVTADERAAFERFVEGEVARREGS
jgi:hypothetical protein